MLRDKAVKEGAAAAKPAEVEDTPTVGGTMEATPAALLSPIDKLLTWPKPDCADAEVTDEDGATWALWGMEATEVEEACGPEGATAETEKDEECKLESPSTLVC